MFAMRSLVLEHAAGQGNRYYRTLFYLEASIAV